jgi:hypothetical protein
MATRKPAHFPKALREQRGLFRSALLGRRSVLSSSPAVAGLPGIGIIHRSGLGIAGASLSARRGLPQKRPLGVLRRPLSTRPHAFAKLASWIVDHRILLGLDCLRNSLRRNKFLSCPSTCDILSDGSRSCTATLAARLLVDCGRTNAATFRRGLLGVNNEGRPSYAKQKLKKSLPNQGRRRLIHLLADINRSSRLAERALHASLQGPNRVRCHLLRQTR